MDTNSIRQQIHKLIEEANDNQLDVILEVLSPTSSRYTQDELNSFYKRTQLFEESGSNGYSVDESHELIRNKHKHNGA